MTEVQRNPCSIRVFLRDGDPDGIRSAERTMSTTQAMAFRRNQLSEAKADFGDSMERPGVYILLGADDAQTDRREAYIGESEGVHRRIAYHASPKGGKPFWEDAIVLVSKDENLTKSHARYVESRLIAAGRSNPRWSLPNRQDPGSDAGRLPLADHSTWTSSWRRRRSWSACWAVTSSGPCGSFRPWAGRPGSRELSTCRGTPTGSSSEGRAATSAPKMSIGSTGLFVVEAGSQARLDEAPSAPVGVKRLRGDMREAGDLREAGGFLVFAVNYWFKSVSAAAGWSAAADGAGAGEEVLAEEES